MTVRCAHGCDAAFCSQCLGAVPRRVTQSGPTLTVDGVERPVLTPQPPLTRQQQRARERGARTRNQQRARRT